MDVTVSHAVSTLASVSWALTQLDLSAVTGASGTVRAGASFVLTVLFGGAFIYRHGGRIEDVVEASMGRPLISAVYGLIAYALVIFVVGYAWSQLSQLGVGSEVITLVVAVGLLVGLLSLGGLGFVVVGMWLSRVLGFQDPWVGLVGVGTLSAVAWFALPFALGLVVWLAIAAVGVGGPTRRWVHSDAGVADRE